MAQGRLCGRCQHPRGVHATGRGRCFMCRCDVYVLPGTKPPARALTEFISRHRGQPVQPPASGQQEGPVRG